LPIVCGSIHLCPDQKRALHETGRIKHICGKLYEAKQKTERIALRRISKDTDTPGGPGSNKTWTSIFNEHELLQEGEGPHPAHVAQAARLVAQRWPARFEVEMRHREANPILSVPERAGRRQLLYSLSIRFAKAHRRMLGRRLLTCEVESASCEERRADNAYAEFEGQLDAKGKRIHGRCPRRGRSLTLRRENGGRPIQRDGRLLCPQISPDGSFEMEVVSIESLRPAAPQ